MAEINRFSTLDLPSGLRFNVWRERLERCRRDLGCAELSHLSVTEIAFSWGFQHQAHFSRVFRNHFNVSPSSCRQLT